MLFVVIQLYYVYIFIANELSTRYIDVSSTHYQKQNKKKDSTALVRFCTELSNFVRASLFIFMKFQD
jgi:hypothetical protein